MKKYKLWIRKYNLFKNEYEVIEDVIATNDIYHEIGYIYCTTIDKRLVTLKELQAINKKVEELGWINLK